MTRTIEFNKLSVFKVRYGVSSHAVSCSQQAVRLQLAPRCKMEAKQACGHDSATATATRNSALCCCAELACKVQPHSRAF